MEKVYFFSNGMTAFFDDNGDQVPELQKAWLRLYIEFLEKNGVDPTEIQFQLPGQQVVQVSKTKSNDGYTWQLRRS